MAQELPSKGNKRVGAMVQELPSKRARVADSNHQLASKLPYPLVGREQECKKLDEFMDQCLGSGLGAGASLYVSGGPGTGKTCSVRAAAAAKKGRNPDIAIVEINCMRLSKRSVVGLLTHLIQTCGASTKKVAGHRLPTVAAKALLDRYPKGVVIIVDEVDQLVKRHGNVGARCNNADSLATLLSLPSSAEAPPVALVAIANAVDLLERAAGFEPGICSALLFQPYEADQLRKIVNTRLSAVGCAGADAQKAMGRVAIELRVRQVAKQSGDCRPIVCLCEQALFQASMLDDGPQSLGASHAEPAEIPPISTTPPQNSNTATPCGDEAAKVSTPETALPKDTAVEAETPPPVPQAPKKFIWQHTQYDPIKCIKQLPMDQQILLCALAGAKAETLQLSHISVKFKELCRRLHNYKPNLLSKDQISAALSALEQRGLLSFRTKGRGRGGGRGSECISELGVARKSVREALALANPTLERCLE